MKIGYFILNDGLRENPQVTGLLGELEGPDYAWTWNDTTAREARENAVFYRLCVRALTDADEACGRLDGAVDAGTAVSERLAEVDAFLAQNAKRMAENLCVAYASEYGVPVKIARLAQTFGEGVRQEDNRVYAQFARAILEGRDIVLRTDGSASRCYCAVSDVVEAVRVLLAKGTDATPYTVANEATFCSVREMAERLIAAHPESGSRLAFDISEDAARSYPPPTRLRLDSSRLRALGWEPNVGLMEMFDRMMKGMR